MALETFRRIIGRLGGRESDYEMRERVRRQMESINVIDGFLNGQVFEATLRGQGINRNVDVDDLAGQVQRVAQYLPLEVTGIRVPGSEPIEIERFEKNKGRPQIVWGLIDLELYSAGLARRLEFNRNPIVRS